MPYAYTHTHTQTHKHAHTLSYVLIMECSMSITLSSFFFAFVSFNYFCFCSILRKPVGDHLKIQREHTHQSERICTRGQRTNTNRHTQIHTHRDSLPLTLGFFHLCFSTCASFYAYLKASFAF
jgi:hypothetical protein